MSWDFAPGLPGPGWLESRPGAEETDSIALCRGCDLLGLGTVSWMWGCADPAEQCLGKGPVASIGAHQACRCQVSLCCRWVEAPSSGDGVKTGLGDTVFDALRRGPASAQGPREPGRGLSARLRAQRGPQPGSGPSRPLCARVRVHPVLTCTLKWWGLEFLHSAKKCSSGLTSDDLQYISK